MILRQDIKGTEYHTHTGQRTLHTQRAEDTPHTRCRGHSGDNRGLGGGSRKDPFLIKKMFQPASIETQWVKVKLASIFFFSGDYVSFNVVAGEDRRGKLPNQGKTL